jgi:hypothetical protein
VTFKNFTNLLGMQERLAVFGGKDPMHEKMSMGLAHVM